MWTKLKGALYTALDRLSQSKVMVITISILSLAITLVPGTALAYVGPGAGITLLGALWAVIVAVVLMVGGLVAWPFRALVRSWQRAKTKKTRDTDLEG